MVFSNWQSLMMHNTRMIDVPNFLFGLNLSNTRSSFSSPKNKELAGVQAIAMLQIIVVIIKLIVASQRIITTTYQIREKLAFLRDGQTLEKLVIKWQQ
mmetsp:Transcript_21302/g.34487  ORF Transcript_21302/g.34487 Transcript_21302/m.34487 type:complete len:98 (-) Transcript_21302:154-447(-)